MDSQSVVAFGAVKIWARTEKYFQLQLTYPLDNQNHIYWQDINCRDNCRLLDRILCQICTCTLKNSWCQNNQANILKNHWNKEKRILVWHEGNPVYPGLHDPDLQPTPSSEASQSPSRQWHNKEQFFPNLIGCSLHSSKDAMNSLKTITWSYHIKNRDAEQ